MPNIEYGDFYCNVDNFGETYCDAKKLMRVEIPGLRVNTEVIIYFVDASHAENKKKRRSHTGLLISINRDPIFGIVIYR